MKSLLQLGLLTAFLTLAAENILALEQPRTVTESLQDAPSARAEALANKVGDHLSKVSAHMARLDKIVKDLFAEAFSAKKAVEQMRERQGVLNEKAAEIDATALKLKTEHNRFKDQINILIGERVAKAKQMNKDKDRTIEALDNAEANQATLEETELPALENDLAEPVDDEQK